MIDPLPDSVSTTGNLQTPLTPVVQRFILHWGEMGTRWGVNRSVAQIHALLFASDRPLHAEEIADTLVLARSNVSNSLKELLGLNLARVVHLLGDRRDHFDTHKDVWVLFRHVVQARKSREFDPTLGMLRELLTDAQQGAESDQFKDRLAQTLELSSALSAWSEEMLRLEPMTLMKLLKLGSKVQGWLREGKSRS
jgi:DNA-binding transcriptional regulator GbsR (MarR family)